MSKKVTGITKNGIEEECRWNKTGSCPRHTIHKGMPNAPVSLPEGLTDEYETSSPMAVFDDADSHIATTKDIRESVLIKQIEEYKAKGWKPVHAEAELDYLQTGMIGASYLEELDLLNEGNNHSQWLKTLQVELVSTGEHDDLYQTVIETPKGEYFKINFSYSRAWDSNHIYTDPVKVFPKQVTVTKYE